MTVYEVEVTRVCVPEQRLCVRDVPAFTVQTLQSNTRVIPPPKLNVYEQKNVPKTLFRKYFKRGDIPIGRGYDKKNKSYLMWKVPPAELDYAYYLPLFFDGLGETKFPYKQMARNGINDLLEQGRDKILPIVPQLILPLKRALSTKNPDIIHTVLAVIRKMLKANPCIGRALVPYYRQLLPVFNLFGGHSTDLAVAIEETLQMLERYGGPDAFINIKYMIPTYESCVC